MNYTYIVTGYMRSGTSMLCRALEAGGLPVVKNDLRNERIQSKTNDEHYKLNPDVYELTIKEMGGDRSFPMRHAGKCVKLVFPWLQWLRPYMIPVASKLFRPGYKIVLLLRHPEEIRQSNNAAFQDQKDIPYGKWVKVYGAMIRGVLLSFRGRPDVDSLTILRYERVLADPLRNFETLARAGWPIDPTKATETVDASQHRFQLEKLVVGI